MVNNPYQYQCSSKTLIYNKSISSKSKLSYLIIDIGPSDNPNAQSNDRSLIDSYGMYGIFFPMSNRNIERLSCCVFFLLHIDKGRKEKKRHLLWRKISHSFYSKSFHHKKRSFKQTYSMSEEEEIPSVMIVSLNISQTNLTINGTKGRIFEKSNWGIFHHWNFFFILF